MKALFVTDFPPEESLPSLESLQYAGGGGWSCVGPVPVAETCIVQVDSSSETIATLKTDARYLWLEDCVEEGFPDV